MLRLRLLSEFAFVKVLQNQFTKRKKLTKKMMKFSTISIISGQNTYVQDHEIMSSSVRVMLAAVIKNIKLKKNLERDEYEENSVL